MNRKTKAILALCCTVALIIGYILGQSLYGRPTVAVVVLTLTIVVGSIVTWRFWR